MEGYPEHPDIASDRVENPDVHESLIPSVDEDGNPVISTAEKKLRDHFPNGIKKLPPPETVG